MQPLWLVKIGRRNGRGFNSLESILSLPFFPDEEPRESPQYFAEPLHFGPESIDFALPRSSTRAVGAGLRVLSSPCFEPWVQAVLQVPFSEQTGPSFQHQGYRFW